MPALPHVRWVGGSFVFRRKVPTKLVGRFGRYEIVRCLKTHSRAEAKKKSLALWIATERLFTVLYEHPSISPAQIADMAALIRVDCERADEVRLARPGTYFDHHGVVPDDADAIVMETHAEDYRAAANAYNVTGVADVIQSIAKRLGVSIAPGSLDEYVAGKEILLAYARSCDETAARLRTQGREPKIVQAPSPDIAEMMMSVVAALAPVLVPVQREAAMAAGVPLVPTTEATSAGNTKTPITELLKVVEDLRKRLEKDGVWTDKSGRGAESITKLLVKFLQQEFKVADLASFDQTHLAAFTSFLRDEVYSNYGRSSADENRTISELREIGKCKGQQGIVPDTLNKHLTFLAEVFAHADALGIAIDERLSPKKLRGKTGRTRARDERPKLEVDAFKAIFDQPCYINSAAWNKLNVKGADGQALIFHCALYYAPMLIYYTGARREEVCGAMLNDIITDNGSIPYIHVATNEQRRIKNDQSRRNIPLHPELIRLGFLKYVKKLKALGHTLLFPDLFSPTTSSPMGNKFYKEFKPVLAEAGITTEGLAVHAIRHLFGDLLKKRRVTVEDRADLLGHGGDTETSERYCSAHELKVLYALVQKIPAVTAHLVPHEINLIPWVERREVAPFSHPSRSKRKPSSVNDA